MRTLTRAVLAHAERLRQRSAKLTAAGKYPDALAVLDEAIGSTIDSADGAVVAVGCELVGHKAALLRGIGDHEAALPEYRRIAVAAARVAEPTRSQLIAEARGRYAETCAALLRYPEAIEAFDTVINDFAHGDVPELRKTVAAALYNKAVLVRDTGRVEDALAAFDAAAAFTGDAVELASWAALALHNKAGLLHTLGETDLALAGYREVVERFADSSSEIVRVRAARAGRILGDHLAAVGHGADAIDSYRKVVDSFAAAPEPAVRAEVGVALLAMADLLVGQENVTAALDTLEQIDRRFGDDEAAEVRDIVTTAREFRAQLGKPVDPGSHAMADPVRHSIHDQNREQMARLILGTIALVAAAVVIAVAVLILRPPVWPAIEAAIGALTLVVVLRNIRRLRVLVDHGQVNLDQMHAGAEAEEESDEAARQILADRKTSGHPYALFLRGFEIESTRQLVDLKGQSSHWFTFGTPGRGVLESALHTGLSRWVPLLGVHNATDQFHRLKRGVPKLSLPTEDWQDVIRELVVGADLIVMQPAGPSAGVSAELSIIIEASREPDTVVVLGRETSDAVGLSRFVLSVTAVIDRPEDELVDDLLRAGSPELAPFPRIVHTDDLDFDTLDAHHEFADLIERIRFLIELDPHARKQAHDARLSTHQAMELLGSAEPGHALRVLQEVRHTQQRLGDRVGLLRTLLVIATVHLTAGNTSEATATCQEALTHCGEADRLASVLVRHTLARCHHAAGDLDAAITTLEDTVGDISVSGSRDALLSACADLAQLHSERQDPESAIHWLGYLERAQRASHDDAELAVTLANLGFAKVGADRADEAITTFTEALELIHANPGDPTLADLEPVVLAALAVAATRVGALSDARRWVAAARALPVTEEYASTVAEFLATAADELAASPPAD